MKTVFKYEIKIQQKQEIKTPVWFKPLSFQVQGDKLMLWALVDPEYDNEHYQRVFYITGTGHALPQTLKELSYVGTVQHEQFVWHLWQEDL